MLFADFHWLCDVRGWTRRTFPLRGIGINLITVYLAMAIMSFGAIRDFFVVPCFESVAAGGGAGSLAQDIVADCIDYMISCAVSVVGRAYLAEKGA